MHFYFHITEHIQVCIGYTRFITICVLLHKKRRLSHDLDYGLCSHTRQIYEQVYRSTWI